MDRDGKGHDLKYKFEKGCQEYYGEADKVKMCDKENRWIDNLKKIIWKKRSILKKWLEN